MSGSACVVGIDLGTDSVRSIVADATTGSVLGTSVRNYLRWAEGLYQHLTGAITGLRLGTDARRILRSLLEATAFGLCGARFVCSSRVEGNS